jgi:hypothetical protein
MKCGFCKKEFKNWGRDKFCSSRCKILGNISLIGDCWEWKSPIMKNGYGLIRHENKNCRAHRVSFEIFREEIINDLHVCHACDNKKCVNPDHLWLGTRFDNMQDASKKRRLPGPAKWTKEKKEEMKGKIKIPDNRGERSGLSRLKESDIYEIRELLKKGLSLSQVGKKFNLSSGSVSRIKNRQRWSHI